MQILPNRRRKIFFKFRGNLHWVLDQSHERRQANDHWRKKRCGVSLSSKCPSRTISLSDECSVTCKSAQNQAVPVKFENTKQKTRQNAKMYFTSFSYPFSKRKIFRTERTDGTFFLRQWPFPIDPEEFEGLRWPCGPAHGRLFGTPPVLMYGFNPI